MTILEDAIGLEERARAYYVESASVVKDPSGKKILDLLAKEESRHAEALARMKDDRNQQLSPSTLLQEVSGLVEGAVNEGKGSISTDSSLRGILQKAMEIEQATKRFYEEKAASTDYEWERDLFSKLAKQELEHYLMVSSLAKYFDRPAEWVESAEFGLRPEEY